MIFIEQNFGPHMEQKCVEHLLCHGTRVQETVAAWWAHINARAKTARIWNQVDRGTAELRTPKNNYRRTSTVMPEWWEFHRSDAKGLLFASAEGTPIPYKTLYNHVCAVLVRAGRKKDGEAAHQFRHTYAYVFLDRGGSIASLPKCLAISARARPSSAATTLRAKMRRRLALERYTAA